MGKKHLLFIILLAFTLLLSACGSMTIELKANGSGKAQIEFPNSGYIPSAKELQSELENKAAKEEGITKIKVKDSKDKVAASFEFDHVSSIDSSSYQIPISDLVILEDDILNDLVLMKGTKKFTEKSSAILISLPSDISDFSSTQITVPGKIIAHSEGAKISKQSTAEFDSDASSYNYLVYEPKSSVASIIGIVVAIVVAAAVLFVRNKRKAKTE